MSHHMQRKRRWALDMARKIAEENPDLSTDKLVSKLCWAIGCSKEMAYEYIGILSDLSNGIKE